MKSNKQSTPQKTPQNKKKSQEVEEDKDVTLDSIIDEFFQYEDQRRHFKNQISNLLEKSSQMDIQVDLDHTDKSLSVIVGLKTSSFDLGSSFTNQDVINFEIDINQKYYPQKGIRIYCKTPFLNPCLCDGRDFLQDIMGHAWHNQLTFVEIAEKIIEFVKTTVKRKTESLYLQRLGKYYLGHPYKYDDVKQFTSLVRIPCVQFEDNFFLKLHVRIIGITDAHFLVFDAEEPEKKNIKLLFWSDIQSLVEIKRIRDEPSKLTFKWKNYTKQNGQPLFYEQTFQIPESEQVIQSILKKIQKFQRIKIWSNSYMNYGNQWDSKKQVIEQLTQKVFKYEEEIKHKFNIENVQKLIDSYNEVIEHYSSVNDYLSDIFLNSLHNLLNRPDVQMLLSNFLNQKINIFAILLDIKDFNIVKRLIEYSQLYIISQIYIYNYDNFKKNSGDQKDYKKSKSQKQEEEQIELNKAASSKSEGANEIEENKKNEISSPIQIEDQIGNKKQSQESKESEQIKIENEDKESEQQQPVDKQESNEEIPIQKENNQNEEQKVEIVDQN